MKKQFALILLGLFLFAGNVFASGTFGNTALGNTSGNIANAGMYGIKAYLPELAKITKISTYSYRYSTNTYYTGAIYDENFNLLGITGQSFRSAMCDGCVLSANFTADLYLEKGWYYIVQITGGTPTGYLEGATIRIATGTMFGKTWGFPFPEIWTGVLSRDNRIMTIWATYEPFQFNLFAITPNFANSILAYAGNLFSGISPLLYLIIGLPLAFWIINKVVGIVRKKEK